MLGRFARFASILLLTAALAACGGKSKSKTTPGAGSGSAGGSDAVGMNGGNDPDGGGGDGGGSGGGSDTGSGGGIGGGGDGGGSDDGGDGGGIIEEPKDHPHYTPTNMDPDPSQAAQDVKGHIKAGRDALKAEPPDADLAISESKEALKIDGTNIDAVTILAHAYYTKKLYDTAETILDMLMKDRKDAAPKVPEVFYVYGLIYDKTNQPERALKAYEQAVALRPDYPAALVNLGVYQLKNKAYDDAVSTYEHLTDLGRDDAVVQNALGSAYRGKSADFDPSSSERSSYLLKAETAFKKSTSKNHDYGPAYYNLGLLYLDADPFPDGSGGSMDTLVRLNQAKTYFDEYKNMPGVDIKLYDERIKNVTKLIKREEKKRKKDS